MRSLPKVLTSAALLGALAASGAAQAYTDPPFSATGVAKPGYPAFVSGNQFADLTSNNDGSVYTLSIAASDQNVGIFNFASGAYVVGNETIKLTANFDSTGHLLTNMANTFEVDGSLKPWSTPDFGTKPGGVNWSTQPVEKLFSVSLTNVGVDSTHEALGFTTNNFGGWANQKQFTGGSTSESLWLYALVNNCLLPRPNGGGCDQSPAQNGALPYSTGNWEWNSFLNDLKNHTQLTEASFYAIGGIATVPLPAAIWLLSGGLAALGAFRRRSPEQTFTAAAA